MLKKLGKTDEAIKIGRSVGPDWTNRTRDASTVESARRKLGDTIDRLISESAGVESAGN